MAAGAQQPARHMNPEGHRVVIGMPALECMGQCDRYVLVEKVLCETACEKAKVLRSRLVSQIELDDRFNIEIRKCKDFEELGRARPRIGCRCLKACGFGISEIARRSIRDQHDAGLAQPEELSSTGKGFVIGVSNHDTDIPAIEAAVTSS